MSPRDAVAETARLMRKERVGALPVVDHGVVIGIIARSDVLDAFVALSTPGGAVKAS